MSRNIVAVGLLMLVISACGDDDAGTTTVAATAAATTTAAPTTAAPTTTAAPATTAAPQAVGDPVQGGVLYDKWWAVLALDEPAGDNPMWGRQATNERSGKDTFRCKECHGWDYRGADGAYGSGSHFTGFTGIFGTSLSTEQIIAQLGGQTDPQHDFSAMGEQAMADLAAFITGSLEDYGQFVNAEDKTIIGGDVAKGETLFTATCTACHGADGTLINFGADDDPQYLGTVAQGNPWEFAHKVRYGQPGTAMPSAITSGWSLQDIIDIVAYSQTLPNE